MFYPFNSSNPSLSPTHSSAVTSLLPLSSSLSIHHTHTTTSAPLPICAAHSRCSLHRLPPTLFPPPSSAATALSAVAAPDAAPDAASNAAAPDAAEAAAPRRRSRCSPPPFVYIWSWCSNNFYAIIFAERTWCSSFAIDRLKLLLC
ncbi:PREDICTED: formin-like protein 6 [Erythranthe guttata]|uniref:formin-like protein 6 n=1 Tax=Erythranthe guttata TaxID=4155 RepID=UPI00064E07E0|nr:PREDICTED: formin-like protein 6 [Erythranthe guttata]|eukprot:XP_012853692.1 PREDICTED: formin-like protein 6 [Erythranthe guttata]